MAVTVNDDRYRAMLNEFFITKIVEEDIGNIWFPQHGATYHTATLDVFEDHVINPRADVVCTARCCDLTPLDYYLWGTVNDKCYADKPETTEALKHNIREVIGKIQLHTIDNMLKNWTDRISYRMASRNSHLNKIVFHLNFNIVDSLMSSEKTIYCWSLL